MTNEPCIPHAKEEWHQACQKINFASKRVPQQSITEKCSGHYALSSAMIHLLHSNTNEEKCLCNHYGKIGAISIIATPQPQEAISYFCQGSKNKNKGIAKKVVKQ